MSLKEGQHSDVSLNPGCGKKWKFIESGHGKLISLHEKIQAVPSVWQNAENTVWEVKVKKIISTNPAKTWVQVIKGQI